MKYPNWILAVVLAVPVSAFAFYKPIRGLIPEAFGVSCVKNICVDDNKNADVARALFNSAKQYLAETHGLIIGEPKIIFCSTETCQRTFGLGNRAGYTLGSFGITIAPRGWKEFYVAHELIHDWQSENFGSLALLTGDKWLIEGMAYALSNDPRNELHEPFESYRQKFIAWHRINAGEPLSKSFAEAL
jgi:hypothetical protein